MYATNTRASKDMKEKLTKMKRKIDKCVIWDFTTSLSVIDGTRRQKVSKDIKDQNNTINQFDLTDIYQTISQAMAKYGFFFPSSHGTFTKRNHTKGHKTMPPWI